VVWIKTTFTPDVLTSWSVYYEMVTPEGGAKRIEALGRRARAGAMDGSVPSAVEAGVRQDGLVMGLEFAHPEGAKFVMRRLYSRGVWAIFSTLDPHVLQYKPGLLLDPALGAEILEITEAAIGEAREDAAAAGPQATDVVPGPAASAIAGLLYTVASPVVAFTYLAGWMVIALVTLAWAARSAAGSRHIA